MKELNQYIQEKLIVNNTISNYLYHPKTKYDLILIIKEKIKKEGLGTEDNLLNLNDIDVSNIENMDHLFDINTNLKELSKNGCFDISQWKVGNVKDMEYMFFGSKFDGDISDWDVSNVKDMSYMFFISNFTGENGDISDWDVSNVENMQAMFGTTKFNMNISNWNVSNVNNMINMFYNCPLEKNPPKWYKK